MTVPLGAVGPSTYWYLTRSTGAVALLLLTLSVALGVAGVSRFSSPRWPRFVVDSLHRNVSLLALAFLLVHILTAVLDSFAPISLIDAFIPFAGSYRPFWLGLGAVSFDLLLAVTLTSLAAPPARLRRLARHPLARLRVLADRAAARARDRQRREKHVAAGAEHRLPGDRRAGGGRPGDHRLAGTRTGPRRRARRDGRVRAVPRALAARWAARAWLGAAARARPLRCWPRLASRK